MSVGYAIIQQIADDVRNQTYAGCQFIAVEALPTSEYSAVGFYSRCGFTPNEVKNPNKDTLRMYRTLFEKEEVYEEE